METLPPAKSKSNKKDDDIDSKRNAKFIIEQQDGFTVPIRVWLAAHFNKIDKISVDARDGSLSNASDLAIIDDLWLKLTLYMTAKADRQFTMERVDELSKALEDDGDLKYYVYMCSKMIDWIRNKSFMAGDIISKHFGISKETYIEVRDDLNDPNICKSFLEQADVRQVFTLPPKYQSLSKDTTALADSKSVLDAICDVFSDVKQLLDKYKSDVSIEEHKFQMFYYFLIKDRMLMKYCDFNDIKMAVYKDDLLNDQHLVGMISEYEEEARNMFEDNFKQL